MFDELGREVFEAGELIFDIGDEGDCAYLIEEGRVEVYVTDGNERRTISVMGKGEMFGEIALIDCQPRTAAVRAIEKTVLVPISHQLVENLLEKSDPILRHLLMVVLERFRGKQSRDSKTQADSVPASGEASGQSVANGNLKGVATQKLSLAHGIKRALERDEFEMYYQPICNLADSDIVGFEALIRWHHPTDGLIPPMDFLWLAEQTGLIRELGLWTLERACRDWPALKKFSSRPHPFVSVNLSPNQLISEQLTGDVTAIVMRHDMPPGELKLELTETVMVEHPDMARRILDSLIALGSSLALDDFGTGHSGLEHLQRYPIATLKIDRAFVAPMLTEQHSLAIVRSSIDLAHSLGMNVVAEGVENGGIRKKLLELGCDYGQGWHFGKPAGLPELARRYAPD